MSSSKRINLAPQGGGSHGSATRWLGSTFDMLGVKTSIDIRARFL
jgi:hypothetical protein